MRRLLGRMFVGLGLLAAAGCGQPDSATLGFELVRADSLAPSGLRAIGLDRDHVIEAICEVLDSAGTQVTGARVAVDPAIQAGEQELRLRSVPAGSGYFARIKGMTTDAEVWECGVTGPFELRRGAKELITIVIDQPEPDDPGCERICRAQQDCPADAYCPSPYARGLSTTIFTQALCRHDYIGQACTIGGCGPGTTCLVEASGWPAGYCSASCNTAANCPGRALCWFDQDENRRCVRECAQDADCRMADSYTCSDTGDATTACLP